MMKNPFNQSCSIGLGYSIKELVLTLKAVEATGKQLTGNFYVNEMEIIFEVKD